MTTVVKDSLIPTIKKYGGFDISACYNCGMCTATCNLATQGGEFPRKVIRYAELGLEKEMLGSQHLWRCYYCGQCTEECPRDADPAAFMMAARRYAIARYDVSKIARIFNRSPLIYLLMTLLVATGVTAYLLSIVKDIPQGGDEVIFTDYMPIDDIHFVGYAVLGFLGVLFFLNVLNVAIKAMRSEVYRQSEKPTGNMLIRMIKGGITTLFVEVFYQRKLKDICIEDHGPWYKNRWLTHMAIFWGVLGLMAATTWNFFIKDPDDSVGLLYPSRLIGTIAGLIFMYGMTTAIIGRAKKWNTYSANSTIGDWIFLIMLFLVGATGFLLEFAVYQNPADWIYILFFVHFDMAIVTMLLVPFTKLSHMIYRPVALWTHQSMMSVNGKPEEKLEVVET
ncbi:MAG: 4Fe-4S dicluster domain-containing protein [Candidatus Kariarchaeaceae archaeon]|jgi:ferredoxin